MPPFPGNALERSNTFLQYVIPHEYSTFLTVPQQIFARFLTLPAVRSPAETKCAPAKVPA